MTGSTSISTAPRIYRLDSPYDETDASSSHGVSRQAELLLPLVPRSGAPHPGNERRGGGNVPPPRPSRRPGLRPGTLSAITGKAGVVWRGPYLQKGTPHSATLRFATSVPMDSPSCATASEPRSTGSSAAGPARGGPHPGRQGARTRHDLLLRRGGRRTVVDRPEACHRRFHTHPVAGTQRPVQDLGPRRFGPGAIRRRGSSCATRT